MNTKRESYNISELELDLELNTNNESFTYEECNWCGKDMTDPKYIYTDLDSGNYCCKSCSEIHGLNVVLCRDID